MEVDALIVTLTEDEDDAFEALIIGEELTIGEELIREELIIGEELIIIEEAIIAGELDIAEELIIAEDAGNTALVDDRDETAEVVVDRTMPDNVLVLSRLDVAAVDDIVELVAIRVDEVCASDVLVDELATRIPATKFWLPEVNEAAAGLKKHIPPTE